MERYDYVDRLLVFEKKLYDPNVHQVTIDAVQDACMEIDQDDTVDLDTILGALRYKIGNLIEICDKYLIDYKILNELYDILLLK